MMINKAKSLNLDHVGVYLSEPVLSHIVCGDVGFPNAGKSSLLQAISRAKPKVAPYPFTTVRPHIGMVPYSDYSQIAVADLPGLIEDSHKNRGLGIDFLRHIERCTALMIIVDISHDPIDHVTVLRKEMNSFSENLSKKQQLIIANKIDLPDTKDNLEELKKAFPCEEVIAVSAKYGTNLSTLLLKLKSIYDSALCEIKV